MVLHALHVRLIAAVTEAIAAVRALKNNEGASGDARLMVPVLPMLQADEVSCVASCILFVLGLHLCTNTFD